MAFTNEPAAGDVPVVIGGVLPAQDHGALKRLGVARVFTPSDYKLIDVVGALVDLCTGATRRAPVAVKASHSS